jgi:hypothetical protein
LIVTYLFSSGDYLSNNKNFSLFSIVTHYNQVWAMSEAAISKPSMCGNPNLAQFNPELSQFNPKL